jgi:hypothetical protein
MLAVVVDKDVSAACLQALVKHLARWMNSPKEYQREWFAHCFAALLKAYHSSALARLPVAAAAAASKNAEAPASPTSTPAAVSPTSLAGYGKFVADLVPRCTDPSLAVRQDSLRCIQWLLKIQAVYQEFGEKEDPFIDAVSQLIERVEKTEATAQFAVVNDLAKVLSKKVSAEELLSFLYPLIEGLLDAESASASGACVVLNGIFRIRGAELADEVAAILDVLHAKMVVIDFERTRTGLLRALRTLAAHHLPAVIVKLQAFDLP